MGDAHRALRLVSETRRNAGDGGDVRRSAHNPEVEGSNPSPATNQGQRPFSNREGAFCMWFVHGFVHGARSSSAFARLVGHFYRSERAADDQLRRSRFKAPLK
jgi:hypothetical protein